MNNGDREMLARFSEKLNNMHEDIIEIKQNISRLDKKTNDLCIATQLNATWIKRHDEEHKSYFTKAVAIIGVVTGILTFGWQILINVLRGLIK